jgi:hypothetical protein
MRGQVKNIEAGVEMKISPKNPRLKNIPKNLIGKEVINKGKNVAKQFGGGERNRLY